MQSTYQSISFNKVLFNLFAIVNITLIKQGKVAQNRNK